MSWSQVNTASGYAYPGAATIDASSTLSLQAGDVLLVAVGWYQGGPTTVGVALTDDSEPATMEAVVSSSDSRAGLCLGRINVGSAHSGATVRATLGASRLRLSLSVIQMRPSAGTISKVAGPSSATATSGSAPQSGNISPSGSDLLVVAAGCNGSGAAMSAEQIADTTADGYKREGNRLSLWYKAFTASQSDIHGQCTFGDGDSWVADIIGLNIESAVSGQPAAKRWGGIPFNALRSLGRW